MTYVDNIKPRRDESWYARDGEPVYDADLRDARKQGLLPRVSSILSLWPKPALSAWKDEQLVLAALTLPRLENEPTDAFAKRIVTDSQKQAETTADWGTRFHAQAQALLTKQAIPADPDSTLMNALAPFAEWAVKDVRRTLFTEQVVVHHRLGYAGRLDLLLELDAGLTICDIKTRSVKNGKPVFYKEQAMQLVAYAECLPYLAIPVAGRFMSVIVNRDGAEPPYVKAWSNDEIALAWKRFLAIFEVWKLDRNYYPMDVHATNQVSPG